MLTTTLSTFYPYWHFIEHPSGVLHRGHGRRRARGPHGSLVLEHHGGLVLERSPLNTKTRMEEAWSIEEVAFNVPVLSVVCFIPPSGSVGEVCELQSQSHGERAKTGTVHPSRVAAVERAHANDAIAGRALRPRSLALVTAF